MDRKGKKCILYVRVSTEMQVEGYSLEGQRSTLKKYAEREEMQVVGQYEDAGKSGKTIDGRPQFKQMLQDIKDGLEIDYVLVYKLSRFGRKAADISQSLEYIQAFKVNLICTDEGIDSSQASGRLLISVLSAVAEIERENIIEQTLGGRKQKAREGGWNGGFAPYGYRLEDNELLIDEEEQEVIKIIYDKFVNSNKGYNGIAKYLNLQGIKKKARQNGKLTNWSAKLVRDILDNPVYCGKIAYGRRSTVKERDKKNDRWEYKQKRTDDYILADGKHEGIISTEQWDAVREKRDRTGIKAESSIGRDRVHLLSGILKCPKCGSPMYTNRHAWTNKDGTRKEHYYYVCSRKRSERGQRCDYKATLLKDNIEPDVIEVIKKLSTDKEFSVEVKSKIGVQIDTVHIDNELQNYETKLREVEVSKRRLEKDIDSMPADTKFRDRKVSDLNKRLDLLYEDIYEIEQLIEEANRKKKAVEMKVLSLDNVYSILQNFNTFFGKMDDMEKRGILSILIKEIEIYRNDEDVKMPLKSITFQFPIYYNGKEVEKILCDKDTTLETCVLLCRTNS